MSRAKSVSIPSYRRHAASGQAIVTLDGHDFYLGEHGSAPSKAEYDRRIAEWTAAGRRLPADPQSVTIAELAAAFRRHARDFYRDSEGKACRSIYNFDEALRPLLKLYGDTPAAEFGPLRLKTVREAFIAAGRVRTNVNRLIVRLRGIFKWGAENEIVPASVFHGLMAVAGLRAGRGGAKESEPIKPVPDVYVDAIRLFVSRQVWAMVQLQRLTGMRPGEVVLMRGIDIDTTGKLWVFRPHRHKTQLHGHKREVYLGPRARAVLQPFLKLDPAAYLFTPAEAEAERREKLHAERVENGTPLSCGNRPGTNKVRKPKRQPGTVYSEAAYYLAVQRGCDRADEAAKERLVKEGTPTDDRIVPRWHVNQLRHNRATDIRKNFGLEAAQAVLGHSRVETTQIYAERLGETAARVAAEVG
ncbi:MAG TPA: site-specific integrase [Tepidisphaeraceae bacterium]|jgi:integrase